jgi:hypothetical protein
MFKYKGRADMACTIIDDVQIFDGNRDVSVRQFAENKGLDPRLCKAELQGGYLVISENKKPKLHISFWKRKTNK